MKDKAKQVGFTRRKLVIGAPTALLLGACGSGDVAVAELGSNKFELSAPSAVGADAGQEVTETPPTSEDAKVFQPMNATVEGANAFAAYFYKFYRSGYENYQKKAGAHALLKTSGVLYYDVGAVLSNPDIAHQLYEGLTEAKKAAYQILMVKYCNGIERFDVPMPYTADEVGYLFLLVQGLPDAQLNHIVQRMPYFYYDLLTFLTSSSIAAVKEFRDRVIILEQIDDRRHLVGTVPDSVAIVPGIIYGQTDKFEVKMGNLRKPAERERLLNIRSWYQSWMFGGDNITDESKVRAGINNFTNETTFTNSTGYTVSSTANKIGADQLDGLKYYINKDVAKNGPIPELTEEQTKLRLQEYCEAIQRQTGRVYESYVMAQYALRAAQQAIIGVARFRILSKSIDLVVLRNTLETAMLENPDILALYKSGTTQIKVITNLLIGLMVPSLYISSVLFTTVDKVLDDMSNSTDAVVKAETEKRIDILLTAQQTMASVASLGLLIGGTLIPAKSEYKEQLQLGIAPAFAISDLTGATSDIIAATRRFKNNEVAAGTVLAINGAVKCTTSAYTIVDFIIRCSSRTYTKGYFTTIPPLSTATLASVFGTAVYIFIFSHRQW